MRPTRKAIPKKAAWLPALALAALGAFSSSCQKGTYLKIEFRGASLTTANHINLKITRDSDQSYAAGPLPDNFDAAGVIKFPVSVVFQLDALPAGSSITVAADAIDMDNNPIAHAAMPTTVMHGKTWTVVLDFSLDVTANDDAATPDDAGAASDGVIVTDASDDGRALFKITDGSVADGTVGCVAATVLASETVSVDYNNAGPSPDPGNMLWANLGPQEQFIGWMKFGLRFIPNGAGMSGFKISKATLNLALSSQNALGATPQLEVRASKSDGWTRKSTADTISIDDKMSEATVLPPMPLPAINAYVLDVKNHDWASDIVDGTITLGIENVTALTGAVTSSKVEFFGATPPLATDANRPTLDLEFCR
jgi:hypothetical protein